MRPWQVQKRLFLGNQDKLWLTVLISQTYVHQALQLHFQVRTQFREKLLFDKTAMLEVESVSAMRLKKEKSDLESKFAENIKSVMPINKLNKILREFRGNS